MARKDLDPPAAAGRSAVPRLSEVDLNVTSRCNLHCDFCSVDVLPVTQKCAELGLRELAALFDEFDALGVGTVRIVGGEPFVRRDIAEILHLAGQHAFSTCVLTNGTVMRQEHVDLVKACGIDLLAFSVDGPTAALHDRSRGRDGVFERVLVAMRRCNEAGVRHRVMTALTAAVMPHLKELVRFAEAQRSEMLNLIVLGLSGAAVRNPHHFPTYAQWCDTMVDLSRFIRDTQPSIWVSLLFPHEDAVPVELYEPLREAGLLPLLRDVWMIDYESYPAPQPGRPSRCEAGQNGVAILPNGDVFGCELMQGIPVFRAGNLHEQSLSRIFLESPVLRRLRAEPEVAACASLEPTARDYACGQCRAGIHNLRADSRGLPIFPV